VEEEEKDTIGKEILEEKEKDTSGKEILEEEDDEDPREILVVEMLQRIERMEQNLVTLERENQLLLGVMTASLTLNLLSNSNGERKKQFITEISDFLGDFEPFYEDLLKNEAPNPFILKAGQLFLDELKVVTSGKKEEEEEASTAEGLTRRMDEAADRWDLLDEIERLLSRYEHLSHLKLPNFWKEAMIELHKYEYLESFTHDFITIPAKHINTIIHKLLREAPCASILQRYRRRKRTLDTSMAFEISGEDKQTIIDMVKKYNKRLFDLVKGSMAGSQEDGPITTLFTEITDDILDQRMTDQLEKIFDRAEENYKKFNMGSAMTEMRIPKTYQDVVRNIIDTANEMFNKGQGRIVEIAIHLLTVQLIYELNNAIFKSKELLPIMQDIKS
jgi:hypothetical protein